MRRDALCFQKSENFNKPFAFYIFISRTIYLSFLNEETAKFPFGEIHSTFKIFFPLSSKPPSGIFFSCSAFASKKIEKQINTEKIEPVIVVNLIPGLIVETERDKECVRACVCVCEEE